MPFINVKTNTAVPRAGLEALKSGLGQAITAIPGKSEQWLMVGIEPECTLYFQGSDAPAAMVEVSIFGSAADAAYNTLTGKICALLHEELSIAPNRIYVKYTEIEHWGWNGGNF
jgi:phenylpyruvate tautomerase PptA (4-oxalocrotonate tautomerase family)